MTLPTKLWHKEVVSVASTSAIHWCNPCIISYKLNFSAISPCQFSLASLLRSRLYKVRGNIYNSLTTHTTPPEKVLTNKFQSDSQHTKPTAAGFANLSHRKQARRNSATLPCTSSQNQLNTERNAFIPNSLALFEVTCELLSSFLFPPQTLFSPQWHKHHWLG